MAILRIHPNKHRKTLVIQLQLTYYTSFAHKKLYLPHAHLYTEMPLGRGSGHRTHKPHTSRNVNNTFIYRELKNSNYNLQRRMSIRGYALYTPTNLLRNKIFTLKQSLTIKFPKYEVNNDIFDLIKN